MKKIYLITVLVFGLLSVVVMGCDDSEGDDSVKYTLSDVVPDPVPVVIDGDVGTLQIDLGADPLSEDQVDAFTGYLADDTLELTVANDDSGVNYSITEGTLVQGEPMDEGEYSIQVMDNMAAILFWNDFMGSSINVGGDYSAVVEVRVNDHFTTETFTVEVEAE